jgi:hypothetical protein
MYAYTKMPQPPAPSNPDEAARWEHTRHRRALMEGRWSRLLEDRLQVQLGSVRRMAFGLPAMSSNRFKSVATELATLYDAPPDVSHNTAGGAVDELCGSNGLIARAGLWPQMSRFQSMVIALREMWMRVDVEDGRLIYRPVSPDMTIAEADPSRPTTPLAYAEIRLRHYRGDAVWMWDVMDIRNPEAPSYTVRLAKDGGFGDDVTLEVLGATYSGEAYPYRRTDGTPILPVVLYHASLYGDRLFDAWDGIEIYEGSLDLSVLDTYLHHVIRDASYPQRWAIGVRVAGSDMVDGGTRGQRVEVVTDPTTILMLDAAMEQQPQVGQFQAGADAEKVESVVAALAHRLSVDAGLAPTDLQRTSGSAKSGYAISLSQEGKRTAQRKFVMQFRDADERLVAVSAALYNRAVGTQFPEGGYSVMYREIPLSPEELASRRTHAMEMMEAGLMDRVEALRLFGSMTHEDAVARLEQIALAKAAEARMLESTPPTGNEGEMEDRSAAAGADVSPAHAEAMADVAEELDAAEAALEALDLDEGSARVVAAVIESLREARGYLGIGPKVEAETELHEEEDMAEEVMAEAAPTEPTEGTPQAAAPEESVAAAATSAGVPASAVAMNGAQVQAAQGIVQAVAKGELPRATGVAMLVQFFNMPEDAADAMMGEVGRSFTITTAAP